MQRRIQNFKYCCDLASGLDYKNRTNFRLVRLSPYINRKRYQLRLQKIVHHYLLRPREILIVLLCLTTIACNRPDRDWKRAVNLNSATSYKQFITSHPQSEHTAEAQEKLNDRVSTMVSDSFRLIAEGKYDKASPLLEEIVETTPSHAVALNNLAVIRAQQHKFKQSAELLARALDTGENYQIEDLVYSSTLIYDEDCHGIVARGVDSGSSAKGGFFCAAFLHRGGTTTGLVMAAWASRELGKGKLALWQRGDSILMPLSEVAPLDVKKYNQNWGLIFKTQVENNLRNVREAEAFAPKKPIPNAFPSVIEDPAKGLAALQFYAGTGDVAGVTRILRQHADLVTSRDAARWTPLHYAAVKGQFAAAELLLTKGADINAQSDDGWSALHLAAGKGHKDIVALLMSKGANASLKDNSGKTAADRAEREGHKEIAKLLRDSK